MIKNKSKWKRAKRFLTFGVVGGFGTILNTALLYALTVFGGIYYLLSSLIATEIAIICNFTGNHFFTFKDSKDPAPVSKKFLKFQTVSVTTIIGTLGILWFLTTFFGSDKLILWNLVAIGVMFIANFVINSKVTWKETTKNKKKGFLSSIFTVVFIILSLVIVAAFASAELLSVSQMGYHSENEKQLVVYTSQNTGTFTIYDSNGIPVYEGNLVKARDFNGNPVECQGNNPCLVGDFSDLNLEGSGYITSTSFNTPDIEFSIDDNIYASNIDTLTEFFKAQKQQNSPYHANMHSNYNPGFLTIADGSFIMESHQASKTLMRLGNAYNRNPSIHDSEYRQIVKDYVEYLKGLQGLQIQEMSPGQSGYEQGFRLIPDVKINNIFVPGEIPEWIGETMDVYNPGDHSISDPDVPVISLCGEDDGSNTWDECIEYAATYYKCQEDEPCVDASYIEETGKVVGRNGFGVATGWSTEFGCYFDVELDQGTFNSPDMNPCLIFNTNEQRDNTVEALFGFLVAIPALYDDDQEYAEEIFEHSLDTYDYIKSNYPNFQQNDPDAGYFGAALFLLYDYTDDPDYLIEAHALRNKVTPSVSSVFISDGVRGPEFYWEQYALHKDEIQSAGLPYNYQGKTPEQMLQDKMFFDWKDRGATSISKNGERVFQFDPNIRFQNSRYILTEGLLASKTLDLHNNPEDFVKIIGDNQISWMTGMNAIQEGTNQNAPVRSYSFIFGIAEPINPEEYHSRLLVNTGFREETGGDVVGVRGTGKQFFDGEDYIYLDGRFDVLGKELGAMGNQYNGEEETEVWELGQIFNNGKSFIPGWINGAFDVGDNEPDIIFNYADTVMTYEFTESTNEIVSTAIEYFSYMDAVYNDKAAHDRIIFGQGNGGGETDGTLIVTSDPENAEIFIDGESSGFTNDSFSLPPGFYNVSVSLEGYLPEEQTVEVLPLIETSVHFNLEEQNGNQVNATLVITSDPTNALVRVDSHSSGFTPTNLSLEAGQYSIEISKVGYQTNTTIVTLSQNQTYLHHVVLREIIGNDTLILNSATNLENETDSPTGADYWMYETDEGIFEVTLSQSDTVTWTIDGVEIETTQGINHEFSYIPDILVTSNLDDIMVTATVDSSSASWHVDVHNKVNPFFDPSSGRSGSILHIFTNDLAIQFKNMTAEINTGGTITPFVLTKNNAGNSETDWRVSITDEQFAFGDNYLVLIEAYDNANILHTYELETSGNNIRAFHKNLPGGGGGNNEGGGGGGGGGTAGGAEELELVYVILDKEVIQVNETQTITLDASSDRTVRGVEARFLMQDGGILGVDLQLVNGDAGYGTWSTEVSVPAAGLYELREVVIQGSSTRETFPVTERSFYAVSDLVSASEELALIYTALDKSEMTEVGDVTLTLDARDFLGVDQVTSVISKKRGTEPIEEFTITLDRIGGDSQYGTWSGTFLVDQPDTTYSVETVTLSNSEKSKEYIIEGRSLYATSDLPDTRPLAAGLLTGAFLGGFIANPLKHPFFPVLVGLLILCAIILGAAFKDKIQTGWRNFKARGQ